MYLHFVSSLLVHLYSFLSLSLSGVLCVRWMGRIQQQLRALFNLLAGLLTAADHVQGKKRFAKGNFKQNESFIQHVYDVGRRYKVCNPDKMRSSYGKLIHVLMDAQTRDIQSQTGLKLVVPLRTVYTFLSSKDALGLLQNPLLAAATGVLGSELKGAELQLASKQKTAAVARLVEQFIRPGLSEQDIKLALYSLSDNHSFLASNRDPITHMLAQLQRHFNPVDPKPNLAIWYGKGPSRLTHDHRTQFRFVRQSLTLWRDILHDLFRLWMLAERDLIGGDVCYQLRNTGQGLQRVQPCPNVRKAMSAIVGNVQRQLGWVGSSAVHLGDRAVPNALVFIDKYNQVARILNPLSAVLRRLEDLEADSDLAPYLTYSDRTAEGARIYILRDFFRHGFNGSGADNNFDAGSCIDGRLTSAWNWCNNLTKKTYYHIFLMSGFTSFDGEF